MTTLAVTGHRPDRLVGLQTRTTKGVERRTDYKRVLVKQFLTSLAEEELRKIKPDKVLTGMALGWDQYAAAACLNLSIPFVACVPCDDQDRLWMKEDKNNYQYLLSRAIEIINVSPGPYATWKMFRRNEYMVCNCDLLLALWDEDYTGGTGRCVQYAERRRIQYGKPEIFNVWDRWLEYSENLKGLT